jgi:hypothetical protein
LPFLEGQAQKYPSVSKNFSGDSPQFTLSFVKVGFGSNMYEMEPVFRVIGNRFVFTSEEVWIGPKQEKIQRDTLLVGYFRTSSIDSIINLVDNITDTLIDKFNSHIMSGSAQYIDIFTGKKRIKFNLHNISDPTAEKVVAILNTYIIDEKQQLYLYSK